MEFRCMNCGYPRDDHNPNLINEPAEGDFDHIETAATGYPLCILDCMETRWSKRYGRLVEALSFGFHCQQIGWGYVSPNIRREATEADRALSVAGGYGRTSVMIVYDPRRQASYVITLE